MEVLAFDTPETQGIRLSSRGIVEGREAITGITDVPISILSCPFEELTSMGVGVVPSTLEIPHQIGIPSWSRRALNAIV